MSEKPQPGDVRVSLGRRLVERYRNEETGWEVIVAPAAAEAARAPGGGAIAIFVREHGEPGRWGPRADGLSAEERRAIGEILG